MLPCLDNVKTCKDFVHKIVQMLRSTNKKMEIPQYLEINLMWVNNLEDNTTIVRSADKA